MSLSNPTAKNPAVPYFMQWRGGEDGGGRITYYDKENETDVEVPMPFSFIVLDELSTITGFSEKDHSGFWSNEVRNITKDELVVKTKPGIVARGKYNDIAADIKAKGAKYAKSIYIAFKDDSGELVIGNLKATGASLTTWIEFQKKWDVEKCAVLLSGAKKAKKGSNVYFVPVFEGQELSEATKEAAKSLDREVQEYLSIYFSQPQETSSATVSDEPTEEEDVEIEDTDIEVSAPKEAAPKKTAEPKEEGDKTIKLADVPF